MSLMTFLKSLIAPGTLIGTMVGIAFGHILTRHKEDQEKRENEFRELLGALATAYTMMQRYIVKMKFGGENDAVEVSTLTELESKLEQVKLDSFRVLHDRIVIARELDSADIIQRWAEAFHNFERAGSGQEGAERRFAERYFAIRDILLKMARNERPYWQPWHIRMRRRFDGMVWNWKKRRRENRGS
jgi:hypothetical protein